MVRSAVQHLKNHGFDLLSGKRRDHHAASKGRANTVPKVRLSDPVGGSTVALQGNVASITILDERRGRRKMRIDMIERPSHFSESVTASTP